MGGVYQTREQIMQNQYQMVQSQKQREQVLENIKKKDKDQVLSKQTSEDPISQKNICSAKESELKEVPLNQLKTGVVDPGTILWVKTIADACCMSSVMLVVEDAKKDVMQLYLYN